VARILPLTAAMYAYASPTVLLISVFSTFPCLSGACERALPYDAHPQRGTARRGAGPAPVQVPDGDEEVGALADGVAAGRAAQAGRQHVVRERAPDQDRRLRVQPQRLGQRRAQVGQPADVVQRCARRAAKVGRVGLPKPYWGAARRSAPVRRGPGPARGRSRGQPLERRKRPDQRSPHPAAARCEVQRSACMGRSRDHMRVL